jgi:hypothetical protein
MSNRVWDDNALPTSKSNKNAVPGGQDPLQYVAAADWNEVARGWVGDLKSAARELKDRVDNSLYDSAYEKTWKYFGILADGTDETSKLQDAADYFSTRPGRLILPPKGIIGIGSEVTFSLDAGRSIVLEAMTNGANYALGALKLRWLGAGAGNMLRFVGANACIVRGISFDGNSKATNLLALDNRDDENVDTMSEASSFNLVEGCSFYDHGGDDCAGLRIGGATNTQVSEVYVERCIFKGRNNAADNKGYGIRVTTGANCKNFFVSGSQFGGHYVHAALGSSGNAVVEKSGFGWVTGACVTGGELVTLKDIDHEGDNSGTVKGLLYDGGAPAGGQVGNSLVLMNVTAVTPLPASGFTYPLGGGTTQNADVLLRAGGRVVLLGTSSRTLRAGGTFPKLVVGATVASGNGGSVVSLGNYYENAGETIPAYDSSGNSLTSGFYAPTIDTEIVSLGDRGGDGSSLVFMKPFFGQKIPNKFFDVQDYGAKGDHTTDDLTAIRDAIAAAKDAGGGEVLLTPRKDGARTVYRVTDELVLGTKFVNPADVVDASFTDITACASYNSTNHTTAKAEPIVSLRAVAGSILWCDYAPGSEKAAVYVGIAADDTQHADPQRLHVTDLTILGQAGFSGGLLANPDPTVAQTSKLVGVFAPACQARIVNNSFREVKRAVVAGSAFWSVVEGNGARHVVDGFTALQHNAGVIRNNRVDYASGVAQIVSGQGVECGAPKTEECATSLYIPSGDNITVAGAGYFEATSSSLTDYQLKVGDGTATVAPFSVTGLHISSLHGKTALFKKAQGTLIDCRFYDNTSTDGDRAKANDTGCTLRILGGSVPFSTSGSPTAVQSLDWSVEGTNFLFQDAVPTLTAVSRALTVTGIKEGDAAQLAWTGGNVPAGIVFSAVVTDDTVTVTAFNTTAGNVDIPTMPVNVIWRRMKGRA